MNLVEIKDVSIQFPGVRALKNVSFNIEKGEIMALCGENGAGKSTLAKILAGVYSHKEYTGSVWFKGMEIINTLPIDAEKIGISLVHQELILLKEMTVAENIFLSHFPKKNGFVDYEVMYRKSEDILKEVGLAIDPKRQVKELTVAMQQMVEIAKALSHKSELIIFDESTSSLTTREIGELFRIIRELKKKNVTVIFVTHKLDEIFEICDTVTVFKDGALVRANVKIDEVVKDDVVHMMIGRELKDMFPAKPVYMEETKTLFAVKNWTFTDPENPNRTLVDNVSFEIKEKEIVGMYGLVGAGRTELVNSIFEGENKLVSGEILLGGKSMRFKSTSDAVENGVSLITEDRKGTGVFLKLSVNNNLSAASLKKLAGLFNIVNTVKERELNNGMINRLSIKLTSSAQAADSLSGGNQQKVVIGKWLLTEPKVLILDEPTKGIDVGAKAEIYKIIRELAEKGIGILVVSSELPEIIGISDRVIIIHEGKNVAEVSGSETSEEKLLNLAMGRM